MGRRIWNENNLIQIPDFSSKEKDGKPFLFTTVHDIVGLNAREAEFGTEENEWNHALEDQFLVSADSSVIDRLYPIRSGDEFDDTNILYIAGLYRTISNKLCSNEQLEEVNPSWYAAWKEQSDTEYISYFSLAPDGTVQPVFVEYWD